MKFQCGKCNKYYNLDIKDNLRKDITFKCPNCSNKFTIDTDLSFSSTCKDSKLTCTNCGKMLNEKYKICYSCNEKFKVNREDLIIDNKDYKLLEMKNGKVYDKKTGTRIGMKFPFIFILFIASLLLLAGLYFSGTLPKQFQLRLPSFLTGKTIDLQVVILKSGKTIYATEIERKGKYVFLTTKDGRSIQVSEKDIMQIARAVIEE